MPSFLIVRRLCFTNCHFAALFLFCVVGLRVVSAEPVPAIHVQGSMHGFLLLKSAEGKVIAVGDEISVAKGKEVHSRLTFRFRDGSIDDETTVFKQGSVFQLVSDHHVQKGPSFPEPLDLTMNVPSGKVTWHEVKSGKTEVKSEQMDLP